MSLAGDGAPANPYPGLRPFLEHEEYLFFGREKQVDVMVDRLAETRFLAVVGTSGSGKSSLVNCGLRPALHRGLMARAGTTWRMAQFRPGNRPLRAMAQALAADGVLYKSLEAGDFSPSEIVEATLRMSKIGLIDAYAQARLDSGVNLLVVADQFEELFRYRRLSTSSPEAGSGAGDEVTAFLNLLLEARVERSWPIYVVLTMRSDFLGDCAQFSGLPEAINRGQYLVPRMSRDERRAAITGPARVGGAEIAPVLLTRLVNDVGDNPDQLSILQHALNRTWTRWREETAGRGPLDLPHYEAIGTMARALNEHAEEAYAQLAGDRQRALCEKIFKALTDKGTDARGIRRPTKLGTLCALAEASETEILEVVDVFRESSRSFLMPLAGESVNAETVIDISHESLMRVWERLKAWVDEEAQSAQMFGRLAETAELHAAGRASLWRDPDLQVALDWQARQRPNAAWAAQYRPTFDQAMRFLRESQAAREEEVAAARRRVRRWRWALAGAMTFVALIAAVFFHLYRKAEAQRAVAEQQTAIATARRLAAEAETTLTQNPNALPLAMLLGVESLRRYPTREADQLLRQGLVLLPRRAAPALRHRGAISAIAFSPDRARVVTASSDGTTGVWEMPTGRRLFTVPDGSTNGRVNAAVFSPSGALFAASDDGGAARVWNASDGRPLGPPLEPKTGPVKTVAFSRDERYLGTLTEGGADVWDVRTGGNVFHFPTVQEGALPCIPLSAFAFSSGGSHAAVACRGQVIIWETDGWSTMAAVPRSSRPGLVPPLHPIAFSPDGKFLASADEVYEVTTGNLVRSLHAPERVRAIAFSPDGSFIALASGDAVRIAKMTDGDQVAELHHARTIRALAFSPAGAAIATAGDDKTARVWAVQEPAREVARVSHADSVSSVDVSADGQYLAVGSDDGTGSIWQLSGEQSGANRDQARTAGAASVMSANGRFLAATDKDGVRVRAAADGREVGRVVLAGRLEERLVIHTVAVSPDGRFLWTSFARQRPRGRGAEVQQFARVWDATRNQEIARIEYDAAPLHPVFSPDAKLLATGDAVMLQLWSLPAGREVVRVKYDAYGSPVFSGDGRHLAMVDGKAIRILETGKLRDIRRVPLGEGTFKVVAFSPDGRWVAGGSNDAVHLAETAGNGSARRIPVKYAAAIEFRPDGRRIAIANWNFYDAGDRSVSIWDADELREVDRVPLLDIERATNVRLGDTRLAFSADGRYLAIESQGTIRIWDASRRQETERWVAGYSSALLFSPDGKRLLSAHGNSVSTWEWGPDAQVARACKTLERNLSPAEWRQYVGDEPYRKTCPDLPDARSADSSAPRR